MLAKGNVEKFIVVTNTGQVNVFIKPDKIQDYSQLISKGFKNYDRGPQFTFAIGSLEGFEKTLLTHSKTFRELPGSPSNMKKNTTAGEVC